MRMIPDAVPRQTSSNAEKRIFAMLAASSLEATALHSLRLHRHRTKVSAEIDFLIVCPLGVLVIEVKGGRIARRGTGWTYTSRHGRTDTSPEGPFAQAESAMYSLRDRLMGLVDRRLVEVVPFGFMVMTPDSVLPDDSVEWGPEILMDRRAFDGDADIGKRIGVAMKMWRTNRGVAPEARVLDSVVEKLVEACRPSFDVLEPLAGRHDDLKREQLIATTGQHRVLDFIAATDRAVVHGGAGTGKTMLAREYALRRADAGDRVALTCYSPVLATYLRLGLPDTVDVIAHRSLGALREPVDLLIVDETQDLMSEDGLELLDRAVRGGLDTGRWVMFMDPENQGGVDGAFDANVHELLIERGDLPRPIPLDTNVRNTRPMIEYVAGATGRPMPAVQVLGGPQVRQIRAVGDVAQEAVTALTDLLAQQVAPGSITVVVPDESDLTLLDTVPRSLGRILRLGQAGAAAWPSKHLTIATASVFKGMENDVIIVAGFDELALHNDNRLYVALTRARTELIIIWPPRGRRLEGTS